ncbi:MAG: YIP1 family protein [Terriglobales bacterium]
MAANPNPLPPQEMLLTTPSLSEGQRLLDVFIAPSKTFTDLRRSASWWAPFLIIAITSFLFIYVVDQKVGFQKVAENQIQLQPKTAERMDNMAPDQRAKVMGQQVAITRIISYLVPIIALAIYAIVAAVLFATVKFAASAEVKYKTMFALIVYTRLPEVLRGLLATLSLAAGVSIDSFNIQNPVATNLGYFIDPSGLAVLRALLTPLDVVNIWIMVLVSIGISCISNVKRSTAFAIVFGWFAVTVLFRVATAAIF